jgi:two-component system, cell cycle response regulator
MTEGRQDIYQVLIADDDPVSRKLLEKSLARAGYVVSSAENGREALELLEQKFYPIVITDWMMPEMSGKDLCQAIRAHEFPGYIYVMMLTALDTKDDIIVGLQAGADDYLTKPFDQAELMARLNTARRILELEGSLRRANDEILVLSVTDPLTGVFNRGYMNTHLPDEIVRARRYGRPLSVIMCDIDHFKRVNDTFGHQAGDAVLQHFATGLRQLVRTNVDWVARYGGEEFIVVLPETTMEGASSAAERLREHVEGLVISFEGRDIRITASFGVAGRDRVSGADLRPETLIADADTCLYRAKDEGRNRVIAQEDGDGRRGA